MTITQVITPLPANPDPAVDGAEQFSIKAAASVLAQKAMVPELNTMTAQMNTTASQVTTDAATATALAAAAAASAMDAASAATAAANASNAIKWVSGTTYADGDVVWSPLSSGRFGYRRIGAGAGTTDPSLDPTHWALQLYPLGLGGATITGSISLVSTSAAAIKLAATLPGQYVQLPVATTCVKAALQFVCDNTTGEFYHGIQDGAGNVLGWVRPGTTAVFGLADNTTSAGVWIMTGISKVGVTAMLDVPSWITGNNIARLAVDANRTMLMVFLSGGPTYVVVYDASSQSWGSPVFLGNVSNGCARMALSTANQVLVAYANASTLYSLTLTISGVGVTPNTAGLNSVATSSNIVDMSALRGVGASWVLGYVLSTGSATGARTISLSGTAPTIGAESALSGTATAPRVFATGSVARIVSAGTSGLYCQPFTISGSSMAPGAAASTAATAADCVAFMNGSGNIVVFYINTTSYGAIFKLTSTTEAVSSVNLNSSTMGTFGSLDYVELSTTKVAYLTQASFSGIAGTVTDTAGTISTGTPLTVAETIGAIGALAPVGTVARFSVTSATLKSCQLRFDCSSSSPALLASPASGVDMGDVGLRPRDGSRSWQLLTAGATSLVLPGSTSSPIAVYTPNGIRSLPALDVLAHVGVPGAANEAWVSTQTAIGTSIRRIESAA
ncbi:hypothetical protein [Duganella violaceipulchra]|uniref:Uncharacterized protein n=1 Tax=Duganella violaceipulchra TaxID=2849652 RepID=A0AA41L3L6_9BURK|nr:hypothetical protein [Duganella violaceicalia]MBV6321894.1 hypothetical protein [Duganella violaceicalia]MCP2007112.1 hypothetical protein [Duganella violaceicalia]